MSDRSVDYLNSLIAELCRLPRETEWVEFKESNAEPKEIGEYISALSNSAALCDKSSAYLVWGVRDSDHQIVGTKFFPFDVKVGNEELENWLLRLLSPKINFRFFTFAIDSKRMVILEIARAFRHPVQFEGLEYIRVGTYKKRLKDFAEKERELWRVFDRIPFESCAAAEEVSESEILELLDYRSYFQLLKMPVPENKSLCLSGMQGDNLIRSTPSGKWDILNLGATLFANDLETFGPLKRKAPRVINYKGNTRVETIRERQGQKGYGNGFENLCLYINRVLPSNEVIRLALREEMGVYPELAVRELLANALIHQDMFVGGSGPMVEIFEDRIEFTNPGSPIVRAERFVDMPPRSRNEAMASLMRRIGVCEERGSGWDKVVFLTELHQLPAPLIEATDVSTRIVLFAHRDLSKMDKEDRNRALYLHSCLKYVNREQMTNTTVRERFGIHPHNSSIASRLIRDAVQTGYIVPHDPGAAPKLMRYIPFWASKEQFGT